MKCNQHLYVQLLDAFYRDMVHFILIVMSLPGPPARAGIFDNPGCILVKDGRGWSNRY